MANHPDTLRMQTATVSGVGELVVREGPESGLDRGVVRTLIVPVTLIGSAETCDLRILDFGVRPVHCAISITPDGPHLRALGGTVPVNGLPTASRLLVHGDLLEIGPVVLELRWSLPPSPTPDCSAAVRTAKDLKTEPATPFLGAKKVKSAARAAEREQVRADYERQLAELAEARRDAERLRGKLEAERTGLSRLRRRFLRKWKRHWAAERRRIERLEWDITTLRRTPEPVPLPASDKPVETVDLRRFELRREQLGLELAGLEQRIANARDVLQTLQPTPVGLNFDLPPATESQELLHRVAGDLLDRQTVLVKQVRLIAEWRESCRLFLDDLERQTRQLALQEETVKPQVQVIERRLADLETREAKLRIDRDDLVRRERRAVRREEGLRKVLHRWSLRGSIDRVRFRQMCDQVLAMRSRLQNRRRESDAATEKSTLEELYATTLDAMKDLLDRERDLVAALNERDRRDLLADADPRSQPSKAA